MQTTSTETYSAKCLHTSFQGLLHLKIKPNPPASSWASARGPRLQKGEKPTRSSLAIHLVTHKSRTLLLALGAPSPAFQPARAGGGLEVTVADPVLGPD